MDTIRETAERVAKRLLSGERVEMPESKGSTAMGVPKAMKKGEKKGASKAPVAKSPGKVQYRKEDVELEEECRSKKMLNVIAKSPGKVKRTKK